MPMLQKQVLYSVDKMKLFLQVVSRYVFFYQENSYKNLKPNWLRSGIILGEKNP